MPYLESQSAIKSKARLFRPPNQNTLASRARVRSSTVASGVRAIIYETASPTNVGAVSVVEQVAKLVRKVALLEQHIMHLEQGLLGAKAVTVKTMSKADGLMAVKQYFEAHDGEVIYPSDVASALGVSYEDASDWVTTLAAEGKVTEVHA